MLNRAEGTEIATELVNEVFEVAFSVIYSHYLEKQAFPHTVADAKHSLLRIIEVLHGYYLVFSPVSEMINLLHVIPCIYNVHNTLYMQCIFVTHNNKNYD